jgi:hypothetical protein
VKPSFQRIPAEKQAYTSILALRLNHESIEISKGREQ